MMNKTLFAGIFMLALVLVSCRSDRPKSTGDTAQTERPSVTIPAFNRDSAYAYVQTQVDFGPRSMGSEGHQACKDWLVNKLTSFGAQVSEQSFPAALPTNEVFQGTNIIARINPGHSQRILLAAHWDTRYKAEKDPDRDQRDTPILGADDGASGVAVLLEITRTLQTNPVDLGVDVVLFDAEDQGDNGGQSETWCLGSQYWARNLTPQDRPQYGILLDMVGAKGATFPKEAISINFANGVLEKVWSLAQSMGYGGYFSNNRVSQLIDDHLFVNQIAGIPMIDIINYNNGFGSYHHTHDDNMDIMDRNTLRAVGQVVLALLYKESVGAI